MRKIRRHKNKKHQRVLIIGSLALLLFLCVGYAAFQTNLSISAKGNIKEKSRVLQAWSSTDQTDFHSDFYRENIVSAEFLDNADVPDNATESWNVSEDKENGGVMAWVVPNSSDSTKYDLYIGAKGGVIANEDSSYLFGGNDSAYFSALLKINFQENFDTSNVVNMSHMFENCRSITSLDLSSFNTNDVINMSTMFKNMTTLTDININSFNTLNVKSMNNMFQNLYVIEYLDLSGFRTQNVTDMSFMFCGTEGLTGLNIQNFDTSNVTNMYSMFNDTGLEEINLNQFDTSKVINMQNMFSNSKTKTINLCSFDTKNVTNMGWMFTATPNLKAVYVGENWVTNQANTTGMFSSSGVSSVTTGQC